MAFLLSASRGSISLVRPSICAKVRRDQAAAAAGREPKAGRRVDLAKEAAGDDRRPHVGLLESPAPWT